MFRFAVPFAILAVLFLPLPFIPCVLVFAVLLAARPRGEPVLSGLPAAVTLRPVLLRSPPL